jgi:hypothetical protein
MRRYAGDTAADQHAAGASGSGAGGAGSGAEGKGPSRPLERAFLFCWSAGGCDLLFGMRRAGVWERCLLRDMHAPCFVTCGQGVGGAGCRLLGPLFSSPVYNFWKCHHLTVCRAAVSGGMSGNLSEKQEALPHIMQQYQHQCPREFSSRKYIMPVHRGGQIWSGALMAVASSRSSLSGIAASLEGPWRN